MCRPPVASTAAQDVAVPPAPDSSDGIPLTASLRCMALRSQTVQIKIVRCRRTGHPTHRITGTIRGRQRCAFRVDADEAQALADAWETERVNNHAAIRARATRLNQTQISEAEAIFKLCENLGAAPMNVILAGVRHAPLGNTRKKLSEAVTEFLAEKKETVSPSQLENYRLISDRFAKFAGEEATLDEISTDQVTQWLKSLGNIKKKTWNSYRNDLSALFAWCVSRPRQWIRENPVELVLRYKKKQTVTTPERLSVEACRELMTFLEKEHPEWVCYFAVALFAGVRPDMTHGEMSKLAVKVGEHGASRYYRGGKLHFSADITKDGRARRTTVQANLAAWIERYPLTAEALNPSNYYRYGQIRARFKIPHDGLRHTCYSAFVAKCGSIAEATLEFGNSEGVAKDHYIDMMTKEEAAAFYDIMPAKAAGQSAA